MTTRRPGTTARDVAAGVLVRVEQDGAFASAALEAELARGVQLDGRDRGLATELVYGSLRVRPWLVEQIAPFVAHGVDRLDPRVRAYLVVAAYQLFFTRVPAFAAVSEAVGAVREARGPRVAAFVNAVLRRVGERAAAGAATREEAIVASAPAWLRQALDGSLGPEHARAFLRAGVEPAAPVLRVERPHERGAWIARLRAALPEASFEPGKLSPMAILTRGAGKPERLAGWAEGAWSVQEEGAQVAALAVGAGPGDAVLDACAGRGNKTAVLARAVEGGAVDACDVSPPKLERMAAELGRLGLRARSTFAVDWTVGSGDVPGGYDRVLVDAPCSGIGTLRRRPEIALRPSGGAEAIAGLARAQIAILSRAADRVAPGGVLVYVVCSVLREEGREVVDALLRARPDFAPRPFGPADAPPFGSFAGHGATLLLLPHVHGTDGYFIARLCRR